MWRIVEELSFMRKRKTDAHKKDDLYDEEQTQLVRRDEADSQQHNSSQQHLKQLPNGAAAACASRADIMARCKPQLAWAVAVVFLLLPFLEHYIDPPQVIWKLLLVASLVFLGYHILTFRRWSDEYPYVLRFLLSFTVLVVELLWENVMVWVVSATDLRKYDDPPGLQDNGEIIFNWLAAKNGLLSWFINGKWCEAMHFLGVVLCLAFSVAWDQHPFAGFGVMARFCLTICLSRILRVVCFMSTVLPSPRPGCYRRRFPPPPDNWQGILAVGMHQLRGFGGCNDLIFSGHGAFWVMAPLVFQAYYPDTFSSGLLWVALVQASIRDIIDKQHYSIDMFLAPVVTWAVWNALQHIYPETQPLLSRPATAAACKPHPLVLALIAVGLTGAAIVIFVAKA